eukprot:CAMPEP_0174251632 /NCGR_PEP_ID=MMETSP0439-20130205/1385_1 /TAXON_ID=0 /ORGANISM="Stereomyxa ramosa, Strain Chinc5" /LENGTH=475 /DNA_ID=CAMNT_0015331987 /DNA_START=69 /DNA_END=1496 /DNA_ORIENTATION=+
MSFHSTDFGPPPVKKLKPAKNSTLNKLDIGIQMQMGSRVQQELSSLMKFMEATEPNGQANKLLVSAMQHISKFMEDRQALIEFAQRSDSEEPKAGQPTVSPFSFMFPTSPSVPKQLVPTTKPKKTEFFDSNFRMEPACPPICLDRVQQTSVSLQDFDLLQILGIGTFGEVRLCKEKASGKFYCLKILAQETIVRLKQTEHVKSEKEVLSRVSHPFIVKLYNTFKDQKNIYFLMEYVAGGELFTLIRSHNRLSDEVARFYAVEIVLAVNYLHSHGIAHRDLKPENLLLDSDGHIKLSDFGFAKVVVDRTWTMCGTPEYIAPEVILSKGHDKMVDWWSLGVLIYEMLYGRPPFSGEHTFEVFEKVLSRDFQMPSWFDDDAKDLIDKLLVIEKTQRLGACRGALDIIDHPWLAKIDYRTIDTQKPPVQPKVKSEGDTNNFGNYPDSENPDRGTPVTAPFRTNSASYHYNNCSNLLQDF